MTSSTMVRRASVSAQEIRDEKSGSIAGSLAIVVGFWWAATGFTLVMQLNATTSAVGVALSSAFAILGSWLILQSRDKRSVRAARMAFLGSAFIWWWCSTLFYAGVGIDIQTVHPAGTRTLSLALDAIAATLKPDLVGVVAMATIAIVVHRRTNRVALWMFALFWGTLQTAKLNVFFGVRNASVDWLPEHLFQLSQFFGPPRNSPLLPVTIGLLLLLFAFMVRRARAATTPFARHSGWMVALLVGLAVVEHAALGLSATLPLWNLFMVSTA